MGDEFNWDNWDQQAADYLSSPDYLGNSYMMSPDQYSDYTSYDPSAYLNGADFSYPWDSLDSDVSLGISPSSLIPALNLMDEYGQSLSPYSSGPLGLGLMGSQILPDSSYRMPDGTIVGKIDSGADVENPYTYEESPDGQSLLIKDSQTGQYVGYMDNEGQLRTYQQDRLENRAQWPDWMRQQTGSNVSSSSSGPSTGGVKSAMDKLLASRAAQALAADAAKQKFNDSPLGTAAKAAEMAGLLYQAFKGKPQAQVKARESTVQNTAPTFQASKPVKTLYAKGGKIDLPESVGGGLLPIALKIAQHAMHKGLIPGEDGGQDDVVDVKAAPGEYVLDAEIVSALGDGNTDAGAKKLDRMRYNIRKHKRTGGLAQIAPKAKDPEHYMKG